MQSLLERVMYKLGWVPRGVRLTGDILDDAVSHCTVARGATIDGVEPVYVLVSDLKKRLGL